MQAMRRRGQDWYCTGLGDGTGIISESLAPLHQALTAVERPATVRNWLDLPPVRTLLTGGSATILAR